MESSLPAWKANKQFFHHSEMSIFTHDASCGAPLEARDLIARDKYGLISGIVCWDVTAQK